MSNLLMKDCCKFQEGYVNPSQKNRKFFDGPIKWLRASDLNDGIVYNTEKTLSNLGFESAGKSSFLFSPNTIAISKSGTIGKLGILKDYMCGNRAVINIDVNSNIADLNYVFYTLKYKKNEILSKAGGSIQKNLYVSALETISLNHSSLSIQKRIAKILFDLDAKIGVNNKINQELEAMAKTLYDYWFVQFDFPAYLSGSLSGSEGYKSSGGKMVFNEELKREIPEGWKAGVLSDIANITMGQSPAGSSYNEDGIGTVFYQGATDFGSRFPTVRKYTTEPSRMAKENDILLSVRAPVGTLNQAMENCCIGRGLAALREKEGSVSFLWSQMEYFKQIFERKNASGTTFGSITKYELFGLQICIPDSKILKRYKELADPLHSAIVINSKQNQKLAELRDLLLPMLMNGQVTVEEKKDDIGIESGVKLDLAAEPPTPYGNENSLSDLFPTQDLYAEVACMLAIENEMHRKSRGKTWVQKTANHLKEIKKEPALKNVVFEEYHWGMFSPTIAKAIDTNPFLTLDDVSGVIVYKVRFNKIAELNQWMKEPRNADFVASTRDIVSLYDDPLINNDLDRIELLNTVFRCIHKLGTTNFEPIYQEMREWRMKEQGFANKAKKFQPYETKLMIQFIKNEIIKK